MQSVLVVDDKTAIREVVVEVLSSYYHVVEASDGEEAIELMTENPADVVILDINMPQTDGWEALRVITDPDNGWPDTKIVMLTVHNEPENAMKAWAIGAHYYLPKPFNTAQLLQTVQKALNTEEKTA